MISLLFIFQSVKFDNAYLRRTWNRKQEFSNYSVEVDETFRKSLEEQWENKKVRSTKTRPQKIPIWQEV